MTINWQQVLLPSRRPIFSDSYLGVDVYTQRRNAVRLEEKSAVRMRSDLSTTPEDFISSIRATFADSGVRNLFTDDLNRLVDLAETEEDGKLAAEVLRASIRSQEEGRPLSDLPRTVSW